MSIKKIIREEITNNEEDWEWANGDTLTYTVDEWLNNEDLFDILKTLSELDKDILVYLSGDFPLGEEDLVPIVDHPFKLGVINTPPILYTEYFFNLIPMVDVGDGVNSGDKVGLGEFKKDYLLTMKVDVSGY